VDSLLQRLVEATPIGVAMILMVVLFSRVIHKLVDDHREQMTGLMQQGRQDLAHAVSAVDRNSELMGRVDSSLQDNAQVTRQLREYLIRNHANGAGL